MRDAVHHRVSVNHDGWCRDDAVSPRERELRLDLQIVLDHDDVAPTRCEPMDDLPGLRAAWAMVGVEEIDDVDHTCSIRTIG